MELMITCRANNVPVMLHDAFLELIDWNQWDGIPQTESFVPCKGFIRLIRTNVSHSRNDSLKHRRILRRPARVNFLAAPLLSKAIGPAV